MKADERDGRGRYRHVVWTYAHNCEVLDWERYMPTDEELVEQARAMACNTSWDYFSGVA